MKSQQPKYVPEAQKQSQSIAHLHLDSSSAYK